MLDARTFLEAQRRRIIKILALIQLIICLCSLVLSIVLLILTRDSALFVTITLIVIAIISYSVALLLIVRRPLWQAMLPICIIFLLSALAMGLLLPELKLVAITQLLVLQVLCCLTNSRRLTLSMALLSGLIAIVVIALPLPAALTIGLGAGQFAIILIATLTLMGVASLVVDRFVVSQNAALLFAEQRNAEVEAARAEVEAARAEVERLQATEQQRLIALVETLELPIIAVGGQMLVVPLVGELDGRRIVSIQARLLDEVSRQRASTVVLDLTGVSLIDTHVAQQLVLMAQAVRLLGARILLSGIRPDVAHTMVTLAIDLAGMQPVANLGAALQFNDRGPDAAHMVNTAGRKN